MDSKQAIEQFHHDSQWLWLHYRLQFEYPTEGIRRRIRIAGTRWPTIRVDADLKRLMNLR